MGRWNKQHRRHLIPYKTNAGVSRHLFCGIPFSPDHIYPFWLDLPASPDGTPGLCLVNGRVMVYTRIILWHGILSAYRMALAGIDSNGSSGCLAGFLCTIHTRTVACNIHLSPDSRCHYLPRVACCADDLLVHTSLQVPQEIIPRSA